jgi:hypothetical protein
MMVPNPANLIAVGKQRINNYNFPDQLKSDLLYLLAGMERACQVLDSDDPEVLGDAIGDLINTGLRLGAMPPLLVAEISKQAFKDAGSQRGTP